MYTSSPVKEYNDKKIMFMRFFDMPFAVELIKQDLVTPRGLVLPEARYPDIRGSTAYIMHMRHINHFAIRNTADRPGRFLILKNSYPKRRRFTIVKFIKKIGMFLCNNECVN